MRTSDFDYVLPRNLIAQEPATPRDSSRLMRLDRRSGAISHHIFRELPGLLRAGDLLVANDSRVMMARLPGRRLDTGGQVEALLLREVSASCWEAMCRPARQFVPGRKFQFEASDGRLGARVASRSGDTALLEFDRHFDPATVGRIPLPPYIRGYAGDPERYQTTYARHARSAAAPTAGLHFTSDVLRRLEERGVEWTTLTLEVGPGTFKPVVADDPRQHHLHEERVEVPPNAAQRVAAAGAEGRRVVAVGTTVVRSLEQVAREFGEVRPWSGRASLMLLPGDHFLVVNGLLTNFHLPRSTLLMLVCAFAGREQVLHAYSEAIARKYRFYSFGDAMLIL